MEKNNKRKLQKEIIGEEERELNNKCALFIDI